MARIPFEQRQRILREVYRHYTDFKDHVSRTGSPFVEYGPVVISFSDLKEGVNALSERKKEAFFLNLQILEQNAEASPAVGVRCVRDIARIETPGPP